MKLLYKINRIYFFYSSVTILIAAVVIYFLVQAYSKEELEEYLYILKTKAEKNIESGKIADFYPIIEIDTISLLEAKKINNFISDTVLDLKYEDEREKFTQLSSAFVFNGKGYKIYARSTNVNNEDIIWSIGGPVLILLVLILVTSFIVIYKINYSIWNPFYKNINKLKKFSASDKEPLDLISYDVEEFIDLNKCLYDLTERIRKDYRNLKIFSENVSHELQTPLAVIRTKSELLLQDTSLNDEKLQQIQMINRTVNRLSKLNSSLVLLMKIESSDYSDKKKIDVGSTIQRKLDEIKEIASEKQISIVFNKNQKQIIEMNEYLFDIMLSNLISNAIKHNFEKGSIEIINTDYVLEIINTGANLEKDPATMFHRFVKGNQSSESTGLGLTIVKQICDLNKFSINYSHNKNQHQIRVCFNPDYSV